MSRVHSIDGLPVLDAKRPLTIHITKPDITRAAESIKEPDKCAVARACYRELHVLEARVHLSRVYLRTNDHNWVRYFTPVNMRAEIVAFDRGGQFQPGEFVLTPLPLANKLGAEKRKGRKGGRIKRGTKPRAYHRIENVRGGPAVQS